MEKVLVLNGSPRGVNGNTGKMVKLFLEGYGSSGKDIDIENVELKKLKMNKCIGCFNCWTKTPGVCIYKDDVSDLFKKFIEADVVIWATPLYHHGMTSILKTFVERTLPTHEPYIVKENGKFTHPERFDITNKKNILISNCGFPEHHNFDIMLQSFERITKRNLNEKILCVMGELISKKPLEGRLKWYFDSIKKAGAEFGKLGELSTETRNTLGKPLVPIEDFVEMANLSWEAEGELAPSLDVALGKTIAETKSNEKEGLKHSSKAFTQLKLMRQSFVADKANDLNAVLEFEFTDVNENYYFEISDNKCELIEGKNSDFTTKIITPLDVWTKISNGEINGSKAMMEGLYKIDGDLGFMMEIGKIFGSNDDNDSKDDYNENPSKTLGISNERWMGISFIPWIISWITISHSSIFGVFIPLALSLLIFKVKKVKSETTYFEKMSVLYFSIILIASLVGIDFVNINGVIINYFSMSLIWGLSVVDKKPLTADYSKYGFSGDIEGNPIFLKTNEILTLFWSGIFITQGFLFTLLNSLGYIKATPFLYILTIAGLKITGWFSKWYPQYIAKGGRK